VSRPIEDYAMIGDRHTAALVGSNGSIDWLCLPRFDSPACFAALLGDEENGRWQLCPVGDYDVTRAYVDHSAALQTTFTTSTGVVTLLDVMPTGDERIDVVRRVTGVRGTVRMHHEWVVRFDYGTAEPWIRRRHEDRDEPVITAVAGPDKLVLRGPRLPKPSDHRHVDDFDVTQGEVLIFSMTWLPSHCRTPGPHRYLVDETIDEEVHWVSGLDLTGVPHADVVRRSLLTLHLMTHHETGGIVAAPTTSLPEDFGGERNWDYRYCWLRDAALTIGSLIEAGATDEARFWRDWLLRAVAGDPADLQIMYAIDGARRLPELTIDALPGYAGSRPVRIGNGAADQLQLDIYGEAIDALFLADSHGVQMAYQGWTALSNIIDWLCEHWDQPDEGIWETRGGRKNFTYGRFQAWVALDRAIRMARQRGRPADLARWTAERDAVYRQVMERGWNPKIGAFTQHYDTEVLDSSLLRMPLQGFIAPRDPMWLSTLAAMDRELVSDSLVYRYNPEASPDGLRGSEGTFSLCTFWYVDALARSGRLDQAQVVLEKMFTYANHLGLYSEEIGLTGEQLGNFPQAFTHLALINAALTLNDRLDRRP
jgi:GH15 family glucan-1,4-alpha-glucosidase